MAGARHSNKDMVMGRGVKAKAREIAAAMDELGFVDDQPEPANDAPQDNALKAVGETPEEYRVANYIVLFGGRDLEGLGSGNKNADGSRGEYFTPGTDLESEATKSGQLPIDWEHGRGAEGLTRNDVLGFVDWKTAKIDDKGVWVERVLSRRNKYVQWIMELVRQGLVGNSSEADARRVQKNADGAIVRWPLMRDTLTVQPMEPRMMSENVMTALKALQAATLESDASKAEPQAIGAGAGAAEQSELASKSTLIVLTGEIEMDEKELNALLDKRDAERAAQAAKDAETERVKALENEVKSLRTLAAKARRLPLGEAPAMLKFGHLRPYDNLTAGDASLAADMMAAVALKRGAKFAPSAALLQAVAVKAVEDKGEVGAQARKSLAEIGLDADDMLSGKANELDYTTQSGYGDEFVPSVWSSQLWNVVRSSTFVLQNVPAREFNGPGDTFPIPLEGADPSWYRIGQATDLNATTGRPDATIGDSKIATAKVDMTLAKVGARVPWSGEMDEDSIIQWMPQVRAQFERSYVEQIEHLIIDGDIATSGSTNINHIGGTPTSTGTKQDLFLAFNGFRKSPLVTTTANSRSAAGSLVDSDFMETLWLMGAAGLYAADPTKVAFVVDPNVAKKAAQLAAVKTRDVFQAATIEQGLLAGIWGYKVYTSWFMHFKSSVRKANTAGKVDQTTVGNNTTGAILAVRWDQWLVGYKRRIAFKLQELPDSDAYQMIATARIGMVQRDTEASAITYNVGV